jgi:hypothetical protein
VVTDFNKTTVETSHADSRWKIFFKGKFTDQYGNVITDETPIRFVLYDQKEGGSPLWESNDHILLPDSTGFAQKILGDIHDPIIPQRYFFQHETLYLGMHYRDSTGDYHVSADRIPVSTAASVVDHSLNITPQESSFENIYIINAQSGKTNEGKVRLSAQAVTITTNPLSNGSIVIAPDGSGKVMVKTNSSTGNQVSISNSALRTGSLIRRAVANSNTTYNLIELV